MLKERNWKQNIISSNYTKKLRIYLQKEKKQNIKKTQMNSFFVARVSVKTTKRNTDANILK